MINKQTKNMLEEFNMPLIIGIIIGILWYNIAPEIFQNFFTTNIMVIQHHNINLKFIINDIFMVIFFALAATEIKQACLPGGDLFPLKKSINVLFATIGGVLGPIIAFKCLIPSGTPEAIGWAIPTATDIVVATLIGKIFLGKTHPAIIFLLLLAVLDDAIGMLLIAVFYSNHIIWLYMLMPIAGIIYTFFLKKMYIMSLWPYIIAIAIIWIGFFLMGLHPALAGVPIVFMMPSAKTEENHIFEITKNENKTPLEKLEKRVKQPIIWGLFFFGLANTTITLSNGISRLSLTILFSLIIGKTIGIITLSQLANFFGFKRDEKINLTSLFKVGLLGGVGLTVAIFVSEIAYKNENLQSAAKMGALLSPIVVIIILFLMKQFEKKGLNSK